MKKLLLFLAVSLPSLMLAQTTCATATNLTANGTYTTPAVTGTYQTICMASKTNIKAVWYKYTPTSNGELTVSSNLIDNDGTFYSDDTRVSVMKGTCTTLTCVDSNDDVADDNYLSEVTVPVEAGTTYYIQWDNYWNVGTANATLEFMFTINFVATPCVRPGAADFYLPDSYTATSAALYWNQAIGDPANYDIDWSTTLDAAAGTGTIVSVPAGALDYATGTITGLPAGSNFRYYVRSNCGSSQSAWQGPFSGYLAVTMPYSNTFEDATKNFTDGFIGFSRITTGATSTPVNYADGGAGNSMYTFNSTTAVSDRWAYTRSFSLQAGETVTFSFKARLWVPSGAVSPMSIALTVGNGQSAALQTTVVQTFPLTDATAYSTKTATFTAPTTGIYNFGLHNNSAIGATQTYAFIDSINSTSVLSTRDFENGTFSVSPNPASDFIAIANTQNVLVQGVTITDLNGRVVKQVNFNNAADVQVNISDLASGMYMMNIASDKGTAVKKIVKK